MYSQAIASAQPRVRVMLFVIVFTEKVNAGSMEASSNVGGKVSSLDCALEIGRSKDTSAEQVKWVHVCWGLALSFLYCTGFVYSYMSEILLKAPVNIITKQFVRFFFLNNRVEIPSDILYL